MGIGAAFATGLVKGFSDNIDREQARRDKESARLAGYEDAIAKAMMEETPNYAGINAVRKMVTKARSQMDSLEPIGPFGKRGRDVVMDLTSLQSSLANVGDNRFINIGSYRLMMSDEIASRHNKDRSTPVKKSRLEMDALIEAVNTPEKREEFLKAFEGNTDNLNALRRFYLPHVNTLVSDLQGENRTGKVNPETAIREYQFFADLLNLGIDGADLQLINATKKAFAENSNSLTSMVPTEGDTPEDLSSVPELSVTNTAAIRDFSSADVNAIRILPVSAFTERGISIAGIDLIASTQGRNRDVVLRNFSKRFNTEAEFMTGLKHATKIAEIAKEGAELVFLDEENAIEIGKYFESNKELNNNSQLQVDIIQGLQGSILTPTDLKLIAMKAKTLDDFKVSDNLKAAFEQTYGSTYDDFQTRLRSARTARQQLNDYKGAISGIDTVKDTVPDRLFKAINSIFGDTGAIDQIMGMIGPGETKEDDIKLRSRLESIAKGTNTSRSQRDTLAFIIAANMARAEDQAGRLSDADIARNLEKLAPKEGTKLSERLSVEEVIISIDRQLDTLQGINSLVLEDGRRGFGVELQERIDALTKRDELLAVYNLSKYRGDTEGLNLKNYNQAANLKESKLFRPANPNYVVTTDDKGTFYVLDPASQVVVDQGKIGTLTEKELVNEARSQGTSAKQVEAQPKVEALVDKAASESQLEPKQTALPTKIIGTDPIVKTAIMEGSNYRIGKGLYSVSINALGEDEYTLIPEQGN